MGHECNEDYCTATIPDYRHYCFDCRNGDSARGNNLNALRKL